MVDLSPEIQQDPFALLVDGVTEYAIFMLDRHGFVRTWNAGAERVKGYSAHEIVGQHYSVFYSPHDVDDGRADRELEVAAAEGRYAEEGWRVRKDGSSFWANVVITSLRIPDGRLRGFAQVVRDETERRNAEDDRLRLRTVEAEERVVRGLHDDVVQRLFGIGLVLSGSVELISDPGVRDRVLDAISQLDARSARSG